MNDRTGAVSWKPGFWARRTSSCPRKSARAHTACDVSRGSPPADHRPGRPDARCHRNRQAPKLPPHGAEQYKKVKDVATGKFYYYNTRTKQSYWTKPKFLGAGDLDEPERACFPAWG